MIDNSITALNLVEDVGRCFDKGYNCFMVAWCNECRSKTDNVVARKHLLDYEFDRPSKMKGTFKTMYKEAVRNVVASPAGITRLFVNVNAIKFGFVTVGVYEIVVKPALESDILAMIMCRYGTARAPARARIWISTLR